MEIEAKFAIQGRIRRTDIDALELAPYRVRRGPSLTLRDLYLDSPDRDLERQRIVLRVRHADNARLLTWKEPGEVASDGVHRREELELALADGADLDPSRWPEPIAERYRRSTSRRPSPIADHSSADGGAAVQAAADSGASRAGPAAAESDQSPIDSPEASPAADGRSPSESTGLEDQPPTAGGASPPSELPEPPRANGSDGHASVEDSARPIVRCEVHNRRRTWLISRPGDATDGDGPDVAELALDEGDFVAAGRTRRFRELEIELKGAGTEADLRAIVGPLQAALPLRPESRSKAQRAMAFADHLAIEPPADAAAAEPVHEAMSAELPTETAASVAGPEPLPPPASAAEVGKPFRVPAPVPEAAVESRAIAAVRPADRASELPLGSHHLSPVTHSPSPVAEMAPDAPLAEAGRTILRRHLERLREHEPIARLGDDPEGVHQMRVATRRLRAALTVLEETVYEPKVARHFRTGLRDLAGSLADVRDADVLLVHLDIWGARLAPGESEGLDPLRAVIQKQRNAARRAMFKTLDAKPTRRLLSELEAFISTPGAGVRPRGGDAAEVPPSLVRHFAGSAIWRRYEEVRSYETAMPAPVPTLHRLRVAGKWLRYTLEFFQDALDGEVKALLKQIVAMQDQLGALNDDEVAIGIVDRVLLDWAAHAGASARRFRAGAPAAEKTGKGKRKRREPARELVVLFAPGEGEPGPDGDPTLPVLTRYRRDRLDALEAEAARFVGQQWPIIAGEAFRSDLARLIARL